MQTKRIQVSLGSRSYPILIGVGLLDDAATVSALLPKPRAVLVTNEVVWKIHAETLLERLRSSAVEVEPIVVPDGEQHKDQHALSRIYDNLLRMGCDRATTLIALGGGVVGDLAGYAAATFQRGIPLIQVPTTLLAMVDSSVGGKTAINHPLGKNMIGAFHQPIAVIADLKTLDTLPAREYRSALAEVVKYALLGDRDFLDWLDANSAALLVRAPEALLHIVVRSCEIKANIVSDDEHETNHQGGRAVLNLGHTFGHAIESAKGYGTWLHGEAVASGIALAARFAHSVGLLDPARVTRIEQILQKLELPIHPESLDPEIVLQFMRRDKKNLSGDVRLILPNNSGVVEVQEFSSDILRAFLQGAPGFCTESGKNSLT